MLQTRMMIPLLLTALMAGALLGGCSGPRSLLAVRESGERAMEEGRYNDAVVEFEEYVQRLPGDPIGRYNLGRAYLAANPPRPVQARENLYLAHSQRLGDDEIFEALAQSLLANDQHEELFRLLRQRASDRQRVSDYLRLGRYAQELGDPDQARQAYLTAARIDGGRTAEVQLALANLYDSLGDRERALLRLRMAYYLAPDNPQIAARIREYGEIPGPSFALPPEELD